MKICVVLDASNEDEKTMDGTSRKIISVMLLAMFACTLLGIMPIKADVSGNFDIEKPDYVALGGPVQINTHDLESGGKFHFYLSADDDSDIGSGDIFFATVDDEDIENPVTKYTLWIPTGIEPGEYYIKVSSTKAVGEDCIASDNSIEVVDGISASISDAEASPNDAVDISASGFDAADNSEVTFYWSNFEDVAPQAGTPDIVDDGEFEDEAYVIPHAYMDTYNIVILVTDGADTYSTSVEVSVKPTINVAPFSDANQYSIAADTDGQLIDIEGWGFPEGTVDDNSIEIVMYDMDGERQGSFDADNIETDVDDAPEGDLLFDDVVIDSVDAGVATIKITVDSTTLTFDDSFYASTAIAPGAFEKISDYSVSAEEGYNGDEDIVIAVINVPAGANIAIEANGENISKDILAAGVAVTDAHGAYKFLWDIVDFPGETYSIKVTVTAAGPVERNKNVGRFEILPDFTIAEDSANVGDLVDIEGTGFPIDSEWVSVFFGSEEVEFGATFTVGDDGNFAENNIQVPEISGGGKDITVKVTGEDMDGNDLSYTDTIVINEEITAINALTAAGGWADATIAGTWVFPGHLMQITGTGWTSGETLTVTLYDEDDEEIGAMTITTGGKVDSDGNVEIYAQIPVVDELYPNGQDGVYAKVKGSTTGSDSTNDFVVDDADDASAIVWIDLQDDGLDLPLPNDFNVAESVRVVGVGFEDDEYTLSVVETETDVMDVTTTYGYFDVDLTMPAMEGDPNGLIVYNLDCGGIETEFTISPVITLSPASGYELTAVTVTGTGFTDDQSYDIVFEGTADYDVLDTVADDDVSDGSFTITVTLPAAVPQQYRMIAVEEGKDAEVDANIWDTATFTVTDKTAANTNKTLAEIIAQIQALDIPALTAQSAAAQAAATAATTAANAATAAANAASNAATSAGSKADAATAAANTAATKADAALNAANTAATAAESAASAANGLTTLVYVAIGASLVAALAAIIALMQISRKIA